MKIGIISSSTYPCPPVSYGSEVVNYWLAEALQKKGHDVRLFAPDGSKSPEGVELYLFPLTYADCSLDAERKAVEWYEEVLRDCDVIHDSSATCQVAEWARFFGKKPCLTTRNGIEFTFPRPPYNVVVLSGMAQRYALAGASAWHGTAFPQFDSYPGKLRDCKVVHYGIDLDFYKPEGVKEDYFVYIGRPHPAKGVHVILEIAKRRPDKRFKLAWHATSPDHRAYEAEYLKDVNLLPNVEFINLPDDETHHQSKLNLYQRARAFINPIQYVEAFGLTMAESLACGTPVIATNWGSCEEVIEDKKTGLICRSLEELEASLDEVDKITPADCRKSAEERFSKERMADDYLKLYEEVISGEKW